MFMSPFNGGSSVTDIIAPHFGTLIKSANEMNQNEFYFWDQLPVEFASMMKKLS